MSLGYKLDSARRVLLGRWYLRRCTRVGRLPRVYGRPRITNLGDMTIGDKFRLFSSTVTSELVAYPGGRLEIGDGVFINYGASLSAHKLVRIGTFVAAGTLLCYRWRKDLLGRNVWLGVRVIVLKGVTIGDNAVIGAGSVVTRDIPANCLAAGVPAKVIRTFEVKA